jgi:ribosome biogenesis GTPase / thiamine phosphate phosphatase
MNLQSVGWTDTLATAFARLDIPGVVPARVALEHTHIYRVLTESGEWLARVSGRLRHEAGVRADFPAVGDWVAVEPPVDAGDARIRAVLPRFSRFSRRAAGDPTEEQVVAANINTVFIVGGLDRNFNPRRIERYLLVAWDSGASPVIVLNKADLVDDPLPFVDEVRRLGPAVPVHAVSTRRRETLAALRTYLSSGQTAALLGSSGVGKSSIVNQLVGRDLLATQDVRATDSRGRHTTTSRQLVVLPEGGVLIDTPGMRELQLWETGEALGGAFTDIEERAADCRFRDCSHRTEPGCAVRRAVEAGEIPPERVESYHKLRAEQEYQARQQDERAQIDQKRRVKVMTRTLNKHLKHKNRG